MCTHMDNMLISLHIYPIYICNCYSYAQKLCTKLYAQFARAVAQLRCLKPRPISSSLCLNKLAFLPVMLSIGENTSVRKAN